MRTVCLQFSSVAVILAVCGCVSAPAWLAGSGDHSSEQPVEKQAARLDPDIEALRRKVIDAHNKVRREAKLPSLTSSPKLQAAAEAHALDMAMHKKMSHIGSKGSTSIDRIKATGYDYLRAGENVAFGRYSTDELMKGWLDSPSHKRNIVGAFSQIGVGCATAEDGKRYWCVTFGLPIRR